MQEIALKCHCGLVSGHTHPIAANSGTRAVCYCDDCQAFAYFLDDDGRIMNEHGGTDVFNMPVSYIHITEGKENIHCVRLTPKGSFRWYTKCCKTPIGLTWSSTMPFIGVAHNFMDNTNCRDRDLGPVLGHVQTKFASSPLPHNIKQSAFPFKLIIRFLTKTIAWKVQGLNKPSVFFDDSGKPISASLILNKEP